MLWLKVASALEGLIGGKKLRCSTYICYEEVDDATGYGQGQRCGEESKEPVLTSAMKRSMTRQAMARGSAVVKRVRNQYLHLL